MLNDAMLVWKLKGGDPDALTRIYLTHKDRLLALGISLSGDRPEAEDALHDVFVMLATSPHKLRTRTNLRTYLSTCVANRLRSRWRRMQRQVDSDRLPERVDEVSPGPDRAAMAAEDGARIAQALTRLPDNQREVVVLHLQGGLTFRAIAEGLGIPINTVQSRYRYGLEKLRDQLNGGTHDEVYT